MKNLDGITPDTLGWLIKTDIPNKTTVVRWEFEFWNELHKDRYVVTVTSHSGEVLKFIDDDKLKLFILNNLK